MIGTELESAPALEAPEHEEAPQGVEAPRRAPGTPAMLVRLRPLGPWRAGSETGSAERVDSVYHSDALFSAVTHAMSALGWIDEWVAQAATAEKAAVRLSSCYPFQYKTIYIVPPRTVWPPPATGRARWKGARFAPLALVQSLLREESVTEDRWYLDADSECVLPANKYGNEGPFRFALRSHAAVDRLDPGLIARHATACIEFAPGAGLWTAVVFAGREARETWRPRVEAAFRLLADDGFGGRRSLGWGHCERPEFQSGALSDLLFPGRPDSPQEAGDQAHWLLSLFAPGTMDQIDWTRGNYATTVRSGRVDSFPRGGELKQARRLIAEGSVLRAESEPHGAVLNITPEGFPHPVYRSGLAVSLPIPWRTTQA